MNIGSNSRRLITMPVISRLKIEKERFVEYPMHIQGVVIFDICQRSLQPLDLDKYEK